MIDSFISVFRKKSSGNIRLQHHKHTITCYKNSNDKEKRSCRFSAPFMPSSQTVILIPMPKTDSRREK